jgi:hypothetical protein
MGWFETKKNNDFQNRNNQQLEGRICNITTGAAHLSSLRRTTEQSKTAPTARHVAIPAGRRRRR